MSLTISGVGKLIKNLDENQNLPLPDHLGWRLWSLSRLWQQDFVAEMQRAGHSWFTDARATAMGHIPRSGLRQTDLIDRMGTSKQAVQQLVDGLENAGVVVREADPLDRRGRIIRYTDKGKAALADADRIKSLIEGRYRAAMGPGHYARLMELLEELRVQIRGETSR